MRTTASARSAREVRQGQGRPGRAPTTRRAVAAALGIGPEALRYYERVGLLPAPTRSAAGYRRYDPVDLARLRFLLRLKQLGFRLGEIAALFQDLERLGRGGRQALRGRLAVKAEEVAARIAALTALRAELLAVRDNPRLGTCAFFQLFVDRA